MTDIREVFQARAVQTGGRPPGELLQASTTAGRYHARLQPVDRTNLCIECAHGWRTLLTVISLGQA